MNAKKKIGLAVILIVPLIVSNLIGGFIGFNRGYEAAHFVDGLSVIPTIAILKSLREGKTEWPLRFMETKLDWQIYNVGMFKKANDSIYNINKYDSDINSTKMANTAMKHAIKYRREFPSSFPENKVRTTIYETLKKYETGKN